MLWRWPFVAWSWSPLSWRHSSSSQTSPQSTSRNITDNNTKSPEREKGQFVWNVPVMATVAVRKKVVSIGHFSPSFCFQSLKPFLFVRSNQEQLYVLIALKIREKLNWAKWARWAKSLNQTTSYAHWHAFLYLHAHIKISIYLSH